MITKIAGPGMRNSVALLMGLAWAFFASACSSNHESKSLQPETFPVTHPILMDTVYAREYVAQIQSIQNVELRARVNGFIEKILVDEGKPVQAGQLLFTIANLQFREDLRKANAQLTNALAEAKLAAVELKNAGTLVDKNIVSRSQLEMAQAKADAMQARIEEARSAVSSAKLNLALTQIKAPFSGIINRIPNKTGSLVEEGSLLTTLSNNKEVFAYFNVSEKEYLDNLNKLGKGNEVTLLMANNQVHPAKGAIETVESEIDKSTGNIAFRARFSNSGQLLRHGSNGKISLPTRLSQVLAVPQQSTFEVQDKTYVYVVDQNNTIRRRSIVPGLRMTDLYVVESGLSAHDRILYEGFQRVKEGDKIIPQLMAANSNLSRLAKQ